MRQGNLPRRDFRKLGCRPDTVQNEVGVTRERVRESESQNNDVLSMADTMSIVASGRWRGRRKDGWVIIYYTHHKHVLVPISHTL